MAFVLPSKRSVEALRSSGATDFNENLCEFSAGSFKVYSKYRPMHVYTENYCVLTTVIESHLLRNKYKLSLAADVVSPPMVVFEKCEH